MPLNVRWSVQLVYGSMYVCMYVAKRQITSEIVSMV